MIWFRYIFVMSILPSELNGESENAVADRINMSLLSSEAVAEKKPVGELVITR